jgi:hypothetical protein
MRMITIATPRGARKSYQRAILCTFLVMLAIAPILYPSSPALADPQPPAARDPSPQVQKGDFIAYAPQVNPKGRIGLIYQAYPKDPPDINAVGVSSIKGPDGSEVTRSMMLTIAPGESKEYSEQSNTLEPLQARGVFNQPVHGLILETRSAEATDAYLNPEWKVEDIQQSAASTWYRTYLPRVLKDHPDATTAMTSTTVIGLQNRFDDRPAALVVYFFDQAGALVYRHSAILPPDGSHLVDLDGIPELEPGYAGSAIIVSAGSPDAVASARTYTWANGVVAISSAYPGRADAGTTLVAPALFVGNAQQSSELCVQNGVALTQTVAVNYSDGVLKSAGLGPYGSHCFDQRAEGHVSGWAGGATITGSGLLAGVVTVTSYGRNTQVGRWAYAVPPQGRIGNEIDFPRVYKRYAVPGGTAITSDSQLHLYNFNAMPATVMPCYYVPEKAKTCAAEFSIPAGGQITLSSDDISPEASAFGSASLRSSLPLAAVASITLTSTVTSILDRYWGYNAAYRNEYETPLPTTETIDTRSGPLDRLFFTQHYYFDMGAVAMWKRGLTGSKPGAPALIVAVIDTGVNGNHLDIKDNLVPGHSFVPTDTSTMDYDPATHGTLVAGVIAARMNNELENSSAYGITGIGGGDAARGTPGLKIMPLRIAVTSDDEALCDRLADAIDYARGAGARVINISIGFEGSCRKRDGTDSVYTALLATQEAGIAVVAGAGNDGTAADLYPAAYGADDSNPHNPSLVVAVAGVTQANKKHPHSNYGDWVDVCAPFGPIVSLSQGDSYASASGTSFSTAFVSGLIGVLMAHYGWSSDKAIAVVLDTAINVDALNPTYAGKLGAGCIDADRASAIDHVVFLPIVRR